ncbi:uncharacterized protein PHALS_02621 [Plasmopara halstedii]|uniref:Uncharacterized protein n=1 Tax=Plasmopara halstedii TaxID=4781 RepID=A0A0P1AUX5_PLAHL|nr:uncharacterized protein PHALS_02621 [Plasmopara halstedii]CEG46206.1 hypothetical protein PHALS_02621 [Plasmopara halstedii]|eukprot:XP_024582575.1 hypothetical protein PHALS_02621 [Plasmopara halstedii]
MCHHIRDNNLPSEQGPFRYACNKVVIISLSNLSKELDRGSDNEVDYRARLSLRRQ